VKIKESAMDMSFAHSPHDSSGGRQCARQLYRIRRFAGESKLTADVVLRVLNQGDRVTMVRPASVLPA
jgi:hypothetical protein